MSEFLAKFNGGELIAMVAIVCGCLTGCIIAVTGIIAGNWHVTRQAEMEASLKQQMLNKGMSAADIAQVIGTSSLRESREDKRRHRVEFMKACNGS